MPRQQFIMFCFCFIHFLSVDAFSQNGTVTSGGEATGLNGTVSYSIGQTDFLTANGYGGTISAGIQQPYKIKTLSGSELKDIIVPTSMK